MDFNKSVREAVDQIPAYVPGKPVEEVQRELGISSVIKLASNENPLGPAAEVKQVIAQNIDKLAYYPDANVFYLKEALAQELGLDPKMLLFGNGSDDVNKVLGETILNPGDEVIIPQPTFSQYQYIAMLMGAKPVLVSGKDLGNDLTAMKQAITAQTKMITICNPNNPTGTMVAAGALRDFVSSIPPEIIVVIDEAYFDFVDDPDFVSGVELLKSGCRNVVIYRTFSKIYALAGLRLGYAIADPDLVERMNRVREPFNVNLLAQAAGVAALKSKDHYQMSRELVQAGRSYFYNELKTTGLSYLPTQANFILIDCGRDSKGIYESLMQQGIIVRATHSFGLPNYIRVTFGTEQQNQKFFKYFKLAVADQKA